MTTARSATQGPQPAAGVRGAVLAVLFLGLLAVALGFVADGRPAGLGALAGAAMVLLTFSFGALTVNVVAAQLPSASLLVAMLTYTLQVVVLAMVFVAFSTSGALDKSVDANWLGVTAIVATLTWTFAQIVGATKARQPLYDLPAAERSSARAAGGGEQA